ncbi:hypothetical protein ACFLT8_04045 [Chloroflexota bacterium]
MKLSKRTWLFMLIAILIIAAAGMNIVRSQHIQQQKVLDENLAIAQMKLKGIPLEQFYSQVADLEDSLNYTVSQYEEAKSIFSQQISSLTASNTLFDAAIVQGLEVINITASSPTSGNLAEIDCSVISLTVEVEGDISDIVSFVTELKSRFVTSLINSVTITIPITATYWFQDLSISYEGSYSAVSDETLNGYLTSDDLDSLDSDNIIVHFWFYPKDLEVGDVLIQTYNGTTYNTWYDLVDYPTYNNNNWCEFYEMLSDSQYFISNFRIRFDSSVMGNDIESINIDDVRVYTKGIPPSALTSLSEGFEDDPWDSKWDSSGTTTDENTSAIIELTVYSPLGN